MRRAGITLLFLVAMSSGHAQTGFKQTQQSYSRVRSAYDEIGDSLAAMLSEVQLEANDIELFSMCINYPNPSDRKLWMQGNLWADMKSAFDLFEELQKMPVVTFLADGRHRID